jgi:peptidoglycan hydrolase-like protein with peptidoglycan-binding domain
MGLMSAAATVGATPAAAASVICNSGGTSLYSPIYKVAGQNVINKCYQNSSAFYKAATRDLQQSYNKCYAYLFSTFPGTGSRFLEVDGIYGSNTTLAIRRIQGLEGVTVDGKYGPATRTVMRVAHHDSEIGCIGE